MAITITMPKNIASANMGIKYLVGLLYLSILFSCTENAKDVNNSINSIDKQATGFYIENGPRQGFMFADTVGPQYTYRCITTSLRNDSSAPMKLKIDFSEIKNNVNDSIKNLVFLLPRNLTPEKQHFEQYISKELATYLSNIVNSAVTLDTLLNPHQTCVMTFGLLTELKYPEPSGICLKAFKSDSNQIALALCFDNKRIPCGQISFIQH